MSNETLSTTYDPHAIEESIYQRWENTGLFSARGEEEGYCIVIPPPNVTGSLHMGHAFQDTIMDILIRYQRMCGRYTLWQGGMDHAGIATQMVVERQLEGEGLTRHDLGRESFVEQVWRWKEQSGGTISKQLRRMGASVDWSRERFTMDDKLSAAVQQVFIRLYNDGLIYRGKRLVNWDPVLHTAVSDLEVLSAEENGNLWHLRYPLVEGDDWITVATTRPETMLGDAAVAVHPDDERYRHLIGKSLQVTPDRAGTFPSSAMPMLIPNSVPVLSKSHRHMISMITKSDCGTICQSLIFLMTMPPSTCRVPEYHGMDRYDARKKIVTDFQALNLLERIDDHKLMVPRGDRSHSVIEPYLTDQWYVKVEPLARPSIEAVEDGSIRFVPENWKNTYFEWMRNIQDWCISRQIWWGHRIPAWYDEEGNIYVARDEADAHQQAREKRGFEAPLTQDNDVLDTWFSSALWPFSTLGWPEKTADLEYVSTPPVCWSPVSISFSSGSPA